MVKAGHEVVDDLALAKVHNPATAPGRDVAPPLADELDSVTVAVVMSAVALCVPPFAAIVANAGRVNRQ